MIVERVFDLESGEYCLVDPSHEYAISTHERSSDCDGNGCGVHNPTRTGHAYIEGYPLNLRADRGYMMEAVCPCGIGHPTLDQKRFWRRTLSPQEALTQMVHGCCGLHCDYDTKEES